MKKTIETAPPLQLAIALFQQQRFAEAENILADLCQKGTRDATAWFIWSILLSQRGEHIAAINALRESIKLNPNFAASHNNLGVILEKQGDLASAEQHYLRAVEIDANYSSALFHLGLLNENRNNIDVALVFYQRAIKAKPDAIEPINNLANIFVKKQDFSAAQRWFDQLLRLAPNDNDVLTNYGIFLYKSEKYADAKNVLSKVVSASPNNLSAINSLALTLTMLDCPEEAETLLLTGLKIDSYFGDTLVNLGFVCGKNRRYNEAISYFERALTISPNPVQLLNNYGDMLVETGEFLQAEQKFTRALTIEPNNPSTHFHLAQLNLLTQNWKDGWEHYRYRTRLKNDRSRIVDRALPNEGHGNRISVYRDQGLGDEIFFLRFLPKLVERGYLIDYYCHSKIYDMLDGVSFFNSLQIDRDDKTFGDNSYLVSDLPYLLSHNASADIPPPLALPIKTELQTEFRQRLEALGPPPYIGLTWRAGKAGYKRLHKEIAIADISKIVSTLNATFICLQRNPSTMEISQLSTLSGKKICDFSKLNDNLLNMTHLLSVLDDYVAVSNTNVHIRASVGGSARILVPHPPEWRWIETGKQSPWFPRFSVYRQDLTGSWSNAIKKLGEDLV